MFLGFMDHLTEPSSSATDMQNSSSLAPSLTGSSAGSSCVLIYPSGHPLSVPKHLCTVCGDRASGKHYGVLSCEGCKGFFKRTIRKHVRYVCREDRNCVVDKLQRNRCQYCRYKKCLQKGMRKDAVQQARIRARLNRRESSGRVCFSNRRTKVISFAIASDMEPEPASSEHATTTMSNVGFLSMGTPISSGSFGSMGIFDFSLEKLQEADKIMLGSFLTNPGGIAVRPLNFGRSMPQQADMNRQLVDICEKELHLALQYVKRCPVMEELPINDQVALVKCGWNELHLLAMGARAVFTNEKQRLVLSSGMSISPAQATLFGFSGLMERMYGELINKMIDLHIDSFELACLRGIILFNPDAKGLISSDLTEACREKLFTGLEEHCQQTHPQDVSRFAKILLRLPSLRSISLKCPDLLFFSQLFPQLPVDGFLSRLLQEPNRDLRSISVDEESGDCQRKMPFAPAGVGDDEDHSLTGMMEQVSDILQSSFRNVTGTSSGSPWGMNTVRPGSADSLSSYPGDFVKHEPLSSCP